MFTPRIEFTDAIWPTLGTLGQRSAPSVCRRVAQSAGSAESAISPQGRQRTRTTLRGVCSRHSACSCVGTARSPGGFDQDSSVLSSNIVCSIRAAAPHPALISQRCLLDARAPRNLAVASEGLGDRPRPTPDPSAADYAHRRSRARFLKRHPTRLAQLLRRRHQRHNLNRADSRTSSSCQLNYADSRNTRVSRAERRSRASGAVTPSSRAATSSTAASASQLCRSRCSRARVLPGGPMSRPSRLTTATSCGAPDVPARADPLSIPTAITSLKTGAASTQGY